MSQQDQLYTTIINDLQKGKLVLPTLPEVALKVREVANNPDVSAAQLAEVSRPPMAERVVVLPAAQMAAPLCKSKSLSLIFRVTICDVRFHG